ncbi:MAG: succinate dehydrogenase / fumarate reductase cytochrome b subunit [Mariniblastus sp.]|jgi:succinate dehydrogenase / fumarate reductase cytochrome b subunit
MNRIQALYASTIGKKFIAAITGLVLFGFLLGHVAGNLKVFTGSTPDGIPHIDEYGHFLRIAGAPLVPAGFVLWAARLTLLASLVLHILVVVQLTMLNAEARPVGYKKSRKRAASLPALWMMFSGSFIFCFIVFHLLHLTTGIIRVGEFEHGYVYNNLANSFSNPLVASGYVFAMLVLAVHLNHGLWSLFQTLGLDNPDRNSQLRLLSTGITVALILGFIAVPVSFMSGQMPGVVEYAQELLTGH